MDNFRDSYFQVDWDLTAKRLRGTYWGKQYDTGRGFAVTVINGGQVVTPTTEVLRLKWEKPDNTTGYVNATIVDGKFIVENIDQMFTVHGSVRADFELSVGGEFVASITFYVNIEKAVAVDAIESSSEFTALQTALNDINAAIAGSTVDSEVILARGTEPTLGARLDSTDAQLEETDQRIDNLVTTPVTLAKTEKAIREKLRPTNVSLPLSHLLTGNVDSRNKVAKDIYKESRYNGDGINVTVIGETVKSTDHSGTKFYFQYYITDEMRKWNTLSFGINIAITSGTPVYQITFFDSDDNTISTAFATQNGSLWKAENIAIPANATYFGVYAQGTSVTADFANPILTYGEVLGDSDLSYYNNVFNKDNLISFNLLSTEHLKWETGSITNGVTLSSSYASAANRIRLKTEHVLSINEKYSRLYWTIPNGLKIGINQYDSAGNYLGSSGFQSSSQSSTPILNGANQVVVLLAYQSDAVINPLNLNTFDVYLGYTPTDKPFLSNQDVKDNIKKLSFPCPLNQKTNVFKYIAHSGATSYGTENTLEAYRTAKLLGMWGAETDIHRTSDGDIVLMHDATVDRTTDGTGSVASLTLAQIKALNVKTTKYDHPVKVPTLDEFLIECKKLNFVPFFELKYTEPNISALVDTLLVKLKKHNMIEHSMIISFNTASELDIVRSKHSTIWTAKILQSAEEVTDADITYAMNLGNSAIFSYNNYSVLTESMVQKCHDYNVPVIYGTANTTEVAEKVVSLGVDGIVTNNQFDSRRPSIKYTIDIKTLDGGATWAYADSLNGEVTATFNTGLANYQLGVVLDQLLPNDLQNLFPSIECFCTNGKNVVAIPHYDSVSKCIILMFYIDGVRVNINTLPSYCRFRLSVIF